MKSKILIISLLLALVAGAVPVSAYAAPAAETVKNMLEEVMAIQTDPTLQGQEHRSARRDAIKKVILKNFDVQSMAKQTLGPQWEAIGGTKQTEFKEMFQDLFLDSYTRLVLDFLKREKIDYTKEEGGQAGTIVKTVIQRANEGIPVDYSLNPAGSKMLVKDVRIDGVSIVDNYQKSFARVIKQESYDGLIKKMRLQQQAAKSK